jgi:hypothetical protein
MAEESDETRSFDISHVLFCFSIYCTVAFCICFFSTRAGSKDQAERFSFNSNAMHTKIYCILPLELFQYLYTSGNALSDASDTVTDKKWRVRRASHAWTLNTAQLRHTT